MQWLDDAKKLDSNCALPRGLETRILQPDEGFGQCVNWLSPAIPDRRFSGFQEKTMKEHKRCVELHVEKICHYFTLPRLRHVIDNFRHKHSAQEDVESHEYLLLISHGDVPIANGRYNLHYHIQGSHRLPVLLGRQKGDSKNHIWDDQEEIRPSRVADANRYPHRLRDLFFLTGVE